MQLESESEAWNNSSFDADSPAVWCSMGFSHAQSGLKYSLGCGYSFIISSIAFVRRVSVQFAVLLWRMFLTRALLFPSALCSGLTELPLWTLRPLHLRGDYSSTVFRKVGITCTLSLNSVFTPPTLVHVWLGRNVYVAKAEFGIWIIPASPTLAFWLVKWLKWKWFIDQLSEMSNRCSKLTTL